MKIENSSFVVRERKLMYLSTIALTVLIPVIVLAEVFDAPVFGFSREFYIIGVAALYILLHLYRFWLNLNFVEVTVEENKLIVRYYSLRFFSARHKSMAIPLTDILGFEIHQSLKGLKKSLILYQRIKGKRAKYPPLSVSAYSQEQITQLQAYLNGLSKGN
jgi:hypothetical protein